MGGMPSFPDLDGSVPHLAGYCPPSVLDGGTLPIWTWDEGTPIQTQEGVPPIQTWEGCIPPSRSGPRTGGTPYRNSTCTCYVAGSMPLAFKQEDFLVWENFLHFLAKLYKYNGPSFYERRSVKTINCSVIRVLSESLVWYYTVLTCSSCEHYLRASCLCAGVVVSLSRPHPVTSDRIPRRCRYRRRACVVSSHDAFHQRKLCSCRLMFKFMSLTSADFSKDIWVNEEIGCFVKKM